MSGPGRRWTSRSARIDWIGSGGLAALADRVGAE